MSHPNRWRNHRGMALSETDCPEVSITIIITNQFKITCPIPCLKRKTNYYRQNLGN
ncbi:hypothetical protein HanIR_Chr17g0869231 [Helianthus annuus]|nr:hypothetical protein HanIR_Chr17g0869231 [Helianthus annuus]